MPRCPPSPSLLAREDRRRAADQKPAYVKVSVSRRACPVLGQRAYAAQCVLRRRYCCPRGMTQASNTSNVMLDVWGEMAKRIAVAPLAIATGAVVLPVNVAAR